MKSSDSELDAILIEIGEYGKFQRFITLLITIVTLLNSFSVVIYLFEATPLDQRCKITKCDLEPTEYNPAWLKNAVPFKNEKPERCTKYEHTDNSSCKSFSFNRTVQETCDTFIYETTQNSIMQDFNLHCDENLKVLTLVGTINGAGIFIGLPIAGYISDRYGRKHVLIWCTLVSGFFGLLRSFSTSYTFFITCEFLDSVFNAGGYTSAYVLGSEFVGPKKRALVGTIQYLAYGLGSVVLGCTAWLIPSWRTLLRVLYPFRLFILAYYWLIPESVRWLLTKNRQEEAISFLRKIAKINSKTISEGKLENLLNTNKNADTVDISIKDLFKSSKLLIRFLICSFFWITCILVYYGLIITSSTLSPNRYLDFILTSAADGPANILSLYMLNKKGRKTCLSIALVLSTASSFAYIVMPKGIYWVKLLMYLISKVGITISMSAVYIITNEIFPTSLRQTMLSCCSMVGRIGSILAPQLILLVEIWIYFPLVVFVTLTGLSLGLTVCLPETKGVTLPDTIKDAENIGRKIPHKMRVTGSNAF